MESKVSINEENQLKFDFFCQIEKEEKEAVGIYNRIVGNRSTIQTTEYLVELASATSTLPDQTVIRPNRLLKVFLTIWYAWLRFL